MAIKKELLIEIGPDGALRIKTEGFKGAECDQELKPIEEALGHVTKTVKASEYYEKSVSGHGKATTSKATTSTK